MEVRDLLEQVLEFSGAMTKELGGTVVTVLEGATPVTAAEALDTYRRQQPVGREAWSAFIPIAHDILVAYTMDELSALFGACPSAILHIDHGLFITATKDQPSSLDASRLWSIRRMAPNSAKTACAIYRGDERYSAIEFRKHDERWTYVAIVPEDVEDIWPGKGSEHRLMAVMDNTIGYFVLALRRFLQDRHLTSFKDYVGQSMTSQEASVRPPSIESNHFAYPREKRRKIAAEYYEARRQGLVTNVNTWAETKHQITGKTLRSYLKEFPEEPRET